MARKKAQAAPEPSGNTAVEGLWDEVFTGLAQPDRIRRGERVSLPSSVAEALVAVKAAQHV